MPIPEFRPLTGWLAAHRKQMSLQGDIQSLRTQPTLDLAPFQWCLFTLVVSFGLLSPVDALAMLQRV